MRKKDKGSSGHTELLMHDEQVCIYQARHQKQQIPPNYPIENDLTENISSTLKMIRQKGFLSFDNFDDYETMWK